MENKINKLFQYFDENFFETKVEIDDFGYNTGYYEALNFDIYLDNSLLAFDYLDIEDYFDGSANIKYNETESLFNQYSNESIECKFKIISSILTLLNYSSYKEEKSNVIIKKSISFLERLGFKIEIKDNDINIIKEYKVSEGSFCDICVYNEKFYKKQLKEKYKQDTDLKKRLKYEYENMVKLVESEYVLKVFSYDDLNDSYLMEICDEDISDYLNHNPFLNDDEILELIREILLGMKEVHEAGIIHRDLHLGNILIKDKHIVLSDFGWSKDTMIRNSLKSTSTPKNSHLFLDPIGLISFKFLDKLSDIYSIGKIIDYITKDSNLNDKLSFIIEKSTARKREKRYKNFSDMIKDFELLIEDVSKEDKLHNIEINIKKSVFSPNVKEFLLNLTKENKLSFYIIQNRLLNFFKLLLQFETVDQISILNEINNNYIKATGYNHFENYDVFGIIVYNIIMKSKELKVQRIAYDILKGCSKYRYNAKRYLNEINMKYPMLMS